MKTSRRIFLKTFTRHLLTISIPVILLGALSFSITYQYVYETAAVSSEQSLEQLKRYMDQNRSLCDSFEQSVNPDTFSSPSLRHILSQEQLSFSDAIRLPIFTSLLNSLVNTNDNIESVYIYWPNSQGRIFVSNRGLLLPDMLGDSSWQDGYETAMDSIQKTDISRRFLPAQHGQKIPVLTYFQKIHSLDHSFSKGMVIVNFRSQAMERFMESQKLSDAHQLYLMDQNHQVLAGTSSVDPSHFDHRKNTISTLEDSEGGLSYLSVIPNRSLYAVPKKVFQLSALLTLLSMLLSLALAAVYSRNTSRSVNAVFDIFSAAQEGRPLPPVPASHDEYNYIITNLISTFVQQDYLKIQLSEKAYRERTLELIALQTQINPHFLFNTLETIHMRAYGLTGSPNPVTYLLENLSKIMRYTLSDPDKQVSFQEEIDYAKAYINIQKFRYKDKFQVVWEYDNDVLYVPVIKMLLQPVIENSISHGLKDTPGKGILKIKAACREDRFVLQIIDSGLGMTKERLARLRQSLTESGQSYEHIGIHNTYKRLVLTYGDEIRFHISSKYQWGTAVVITFPAGRGNERSSNLI